MIATKAEFALRHTSNGPDGLRIHCITATRRIKSLGLWPAARYKYATGCCMIWYNKKVAISGLSKVPHCEYHPKIFAGFQSACIAGLHALHVRGERAAHSAPRTTTLHEVTAAPNAAMSPRPICHSHRSSRVHSKGSRAYTRAYRGGIWSEIPTQPWNQEVQPKDGRNFRV